MPAASLHTWECEKVLSLGNLGLSPAPRGMAAPLQTGGRTGPESQLFSLVRQCCWGLRGTSRGWPYWIAVLGTHRVFLSIEFCGFHLPRAAFLMLRAPHLAPCSTVGSTAVPVLLAPPTCPTCGWGILECLESICSYITNIWTRSP